VQLVWFALVGWWLGQAWVGRRVVLAATIIGMPLAVIMLNRVPESHGAARRDGTARAELEWPHGRDRKCTVTTSCWRATLTIILDRLVGQRNCGWKLGLIAMMT